MKDEMYYDCLFDDEDEVYETVGRVSDLTTYVQIFEKPTSSSKVIGGVRSGSEVVVDLTETTNLYYKVYTVSGVEGYCVKELIEIDE